MENVSIEKCLEKIPNKFELSIVAMNRARNILLGAKTDIKDNKYAKKSVNKSLVEIENQKLDLESFRNDIKQNLLINNLFIKNINDNYETDKDDHNDSSDLSITEEDIDNESDLDDYEGEDEEEDFSDIESDNDLE